MSVLDNLGFKIFRLMEVKEQDEFLLYDKNTQKFNQFSQKRLISMLDYLFFERGIDYKDIAVSKLSYSDKVKNTQILSDWIKNESKIIDNLGYLPKNELFFTENDKILFNLYRKSALLSKKCNQGEFKNIKKLILNLVGGNKKEYDYFINWIGWQIQNPLHRLPTSIILQGEHGTGKTKFCELILKNIFGSNFCEIGQSDINKEYNDFILGKQLIVANEVIHNDNKLLVPDKLKNFVTDQYISINRKFKDTVYMKNYSQWIFVTNNDMPLKIERGDRRYTIFKSKKLKNGTQLIDDLLDNLEQELEHFVAYLFSLDIEFKYVSKPIMNEAKEDLIKLSQNSVEEFMDYIKVMGGIDLFAKKFNFSNEHLIINIEEGFGVPTNVFYELYVKYCSQAGITHKFTRRGFTIQLKRLGFGSKVAKLNEESIRIIQIPEATK